MMLGYQAVRRHMKIIIIIENTTKIVSSLTLKL